MACTLMPLNPASWLASRELRLAQEMACDQESLVGSRISPARYAALLIWLSEIPGTHMGLVPGTVGVAGAHAWMKRRLLALRAESRTSCTVTAVATIALGLLVLTLVPWRIGATTKPALAASPEPAVTQAMALARTEAVTIGGKAGLVLGKSTAEVVRRVMGNPDEYYDVINRRDVKPGEKLNYYSMIYFKDNVRLYIANGTLVALEVQAPSYTFKGITVGSRAEDLYRLIGTPQSFVDIVRDPKTYEERITGRSGSGKPTEYRMHDAVSGDALGYSIPEMHAWFVVKQSKVWSIGRDLGQDFVSRPSETTEEAMRLSRAECGQDTVWDITRFLGDPSVYVDSAGKRLKLKRADAMAADALIMEYSGAELYMEHGVLQWMEITLADSGETVSSYTTHGIGLGTTVEEAYSLLGKPDRVVYGEPDATPLNATATLFTYRTSEGADMVAYRVPKYGLLVWFENGKATRIRRFVPITK